MLTILSPAKTLDFKTNYTFSKYTIPEFLDESYVLVKELKKINLNGVLK